MSNYANFEGTSFGSASQKIQEFEEIILRELESNAQQSQDSSEEKKPSTKSRTHTPVIVFGVIEIVRKGGRVFHRALTNKGVFFVEGNVPKKFPCLGILETRVTEWRTYQTVYITGTGITVEEFRKYEKWLAEEFRSYKKWL
jgi:hypothetical protein